MRWVWTLLSAIAVLVLAAVLLLLFLPGEKIARLAADQVKAQTGRTLEFTGEVGISWYPVFGVTTGPVSLSNADWSQAGPMFTAESAAIGVDVMAALRGKTRIKRIEAVRPEILLEKAADGRSNWDLGKPGDAADQPAAEGSSALGGVLLERLDVRNARLRYVDHGGDSFDYDNVDASLRWPKRSKPADISVTLRPAGSNVVLNAQVEKLARLLKGKLSRMSATLKVEGGTVRFEGRAGLDPQMAGRLEADLARPRDFLAALGLSGGVDGKASLSGEVTLTRKGQFSLREGVLAAMGNTLSLQADVSQGKTRPKVAAQVTAGKLDLSAFAGGPSDTGSAGWSKTPIDMGFLSAFNGEIGLRADSIVLGNLAFGKSRMVVNVKRSRAVFSLNELRGYDGLITGEFVANNRDGLSIGGSMKARQVELKSLLQATMGVSRLSGKADGNVKFLGVGASMHAIMNSLKGDGAIAVGRGIIAGVDLDSLFRGVPSGGSTVFDSLTGTFTMAKGVARNDDLRLDLPSIIGRGEGRIGIGARDINYTFTPQLRSENDDGIAVPVKVRGPWGNPRIWPDLGAVVDQNFQEEKKALEKEAEEKIKKKLGVEGEEGQSVEDAIEDKVTDKLLDLLGAD